MGFHVVFKLYPRREKHQPTSPAAMDNIDFSGGGGAAVLFSERSLGRAWPRTSGRSRSAAMRMETDAADRTHEKTGW